MNNISISQLQHAITIKQQIENLEAELAQILSGASSGKPGPPGRGVGRKSEPSPVAKTTKRKMSAAGRARIAAAARARWKKAKASGKSSLAG